MSEDSWPRVLDTSGNQNGIISQDEMPPEVLNGFIGHIDKLRLYVGIASLCSFAAAEL